MKVLKLVGASVMVTIHNEKGEIRMLFLQALAQLKSGSAMKRTKWSESEGYLKILPGMSYVWKIVLTPQPNAGNFIFSIEDFTSDDWVEYIEVKEPIESQKEHKKEK